MKRVDSADPGVFELRARLSFARILVGLPFAVAGLAILAAGFGVLPVQIPELAAPRILFMVIGSVLTAFGMAAVGWSRGIRIDRHQRTVVSWFGIFVPIRSRCRQLADSQRVHLAKQVQSGQKSSPTVYPVCIDDSVGAKITLDTDLDYHRSRRLAEDVARFLHQPMVDSSSGDEVVREADYLDESLRDRVRRLGERVELPAPPATMQSQVQMDSGSVIIDLPATVDLRGVLGLVTAALVSGFVGFAVFLVASAPTSGVVRIAVAAFGMLFAILALGGAVFKLRRGSGATRVTVTRAALSMERGGKTTEIPADEIEELSVAGRDVTQLLESMPDGSAVVNSRLLDSPEAASRMAREGGPPTVGPTLAGAVRFFAAMVPDAMSIIARSDRTTLRFGNGLDADELAYLCAAITRQLVS